MNFNYLRFPGGKPKAFTLSYDDGVIQDTALIKLMLKHGIKGTFNLNSGLFRKSDLPSSNEQWHIRHTKEDAKALYSSACAEVAVHGYKHAHIGELAQSVITKELLDDRCALEATFNKIIKGACYPYGCYNDKVRLAAQAAGISYARSCGSTYDYSLPEDWLNWRPTCQHSDNRLPELCNTFKAADPKREPMLFFVWGHSYQFDLDNSWCIIENLFDAIKTEKDIWFATNGEIYDYVNAFNALQYSCDGSMAYNPSALDIHLMCNYVPVKITAGHIVKLPEYHEA